MMGLYNSLFKLKKNFLNFIKALLSLMGQKFDKLVPYASTICMEILKNDTFHIEVDRFLKLLDRALESQNFFEQVN